MKYQRFEPEGWEENFRPMSKEYLENAMRKGTILQGIVKKCDDSYNLHVDFGNNIIGVIPRSEVEAVNVDETGFPKPNICVSKVNKYVQFKITDEVSKNKFILSRKQVGNEALQWVKDSLKEGEIVNGIVKSIQPYGAFVEIGGGIVGLLHIEDISVARIKTPAERLKIGQKVKIMIKSIDRENERVILSYKELLGTWEENVKKIEEGSVVSGIAREIEKNKNGIFVELMPNLVGLAEYKDKIEYGQEVSVLVRKIIPEKRKIKLLIV